MGGAAAIVKPPGRVALLPPGFVTVTLRGPGVALAAITTVAVRLVAEPKLVWVTVVSGPKLLAAPVWKLLPVRVTVSVWPSAPWDGVTVVSVGSATMVTSAVVLEPSARRAWTRTWVPAGKTLGERSGANR